MYTEPYGAQPLNSGRVWEQWSGDRGDILRVDLDLTKPVCREGVFVS